MIEDPSRREVLARLGAAALAQGARTVEASPADLRIAGQAAELRLIARTSRTLQVTFLPIEANGQAQPVPADDVILAPLFATTLLAKRNLDAPASVKLGALEVRVTNPPLALTVRDASGKTLQSLEIDAAGGAVSFQNSRGPAFGLGEGGPQFDRRRERYTTQNGQFSPDKRVEGARLPVPWLIGSDGWALFFHQPFGSIDLTGTEGRFAPLAGSPPTPLDFFLVVAGQPAEILREYALLTGIPHLPPLWSLGYQQSHRTLASRAEIMDEARTFREKQLPCDTLIYLGTGFSPSGWNTGHGSFAFNQKVFPDPAAIVRQLHDEHFHVILHLTRPPETLHGRVTDTGAAAADKNDAANYWATHREVFRLGVDGWWPDEGDALSPQSRLARNRMYWEGPLLDRPGQRPWALNRNGYAGIQRYGWLWSGDIDSDWKAFAAQIPVGLNTGLSGIPYWGSDTGGFVPTKELTGELYARWFQFSCFCPLFRSHGRNWKLHLPWGWNSGDYGPLETDEANLPDAGELHNPAIEPICRKYLNLRYRLLPYLYSAVEESSRTGMPIMRALWLHYPDDEQAVRTGDEYLWGRDILVAPVIAPGATTRRVYLPRGTWYDFWTNQRSEGGRFIDRPVDLATLPLYVRAGAILPLAPPRQWITEAAENPATLRVYPGADGEFTLYEDDGETFRFERGEYMRTALRWAAATGQLHFSLAAGSRMLPPAPRTWEVELAGTGLRRTVEFAGSAMTLDLTAK
jgi:alpha-glucosidase (family GH31 glycosyl hydrolase)